MIKCSERGFLADEGKTFIRKSDGFDMGKDLWLGLYDSINNYIEEIINNDDNDYGD